MDERQLEELSDAVFHLLEIQAEGLTLCRNLEISSEAGSSISSLLSSMVEQYQNLIHDMSRKFGISISKLQKQMQFGTPETPILSPPIQSGFVVPPFPLNNPLVSFFHECHVV